MVRRAKPMEEHGLDEVDAFSAAKDKQMLDDVPNAPASESEEEEEVLALSDEASQSSDDDEYLGKNQEEEVESDENWGASRNDYYGGDNADDDQVAKQMEQEALRQQKRHLEELNVEDYMDEDVEDWKSSNSKPVEEAKESLDPQSRLEVLKSSHPEFISFLKEISKLKPLLDSFKNGSRLADKVKFTALSTYLGSISAYLALFISNIAEGEDFSFKNHSIMTGILNAREIWRQASELPDVELEQGISEEEDEEQPAEDEEEEGEIDERDESMIDVPADEIDLKTRRQIKKLPSKRDDEIDDIDAEEKSQRKKTLRFYTSKIDQQENKKNVKYSGDLDLPYRERLFERKQRLMDEARKRGENGPGEDLDNLPMNSEDENQLRQINGEDYYNQVAGDRQASKESRKQAHQLAVDAAKQGKLAELEETMGKDGKRAINYQILKNRGLTPNRKKGDRNARVKKRKKYEKAKKKLSSVRSVHKADHGPYQGEKTGIRKGLSKSIKF